jgi:DNA polymerase
VVRPVDALLDFLRAQQARGLSHLHLDEEARTGLRALNERIRSGSKPGAAPALPPQATASAPPTAAAVRQSPQPAPTPAPAPRPAPVAKLVITGDSRDAKLASLRRQAETWAPALALGTLRDVMVFATGDPAARIMLVGEAPGHEEEKKREPFVGPAGQKLDLILKAMGLERAAVYISNIVKFRPATARQTTNNRPPSPAEIAACLPLIRAEIDIIRPDCLIALGGTAATGLLDTTASVAALRGSWHDYQGIPLRVTYHPSYLLRSAQDIATKRLVWEDMLAVMDRLGMPISAKQRRFFLPPP